MAQTGGYEVNALQAPYGTYTATISETVSLGDLVHPDGATEATTTTYKTNTAALISVGKCATNGDEALVCGIAMEAKTYSATAIDNTIAVATNGIFLMSAASQTVTAGANVCQIGGASTFAVKNTESGGRQIGIALTAANGGASDYVLVLVNLGHVGAAA
jgi:hypothetical protein